MINYFYSPFCAKTVAEGHNPSLLMQFILKEIVRNPDGVIEENFNQWGPFGWSESKPHTQKLREYFSLLPLAFPDLTAPILTLGGKVKDLIPLLEPHILAESQNESLLLFLVRHEKELAVKPLLCKICPEGTEAIKERIAQGFRKRGYHFTRWTHSSKKP